MNETPLTPEEETALRDAVLNPTLLAKSFGYAEDELLEAIRRLLATLDAARSTDGLHHHDVNGVALWFQGTGGKPVGGPEDD